VNFWNSNFHTDNFVSLAKFATAFVERFQNGTDGFPVYPAEVLFTIVDHFIARRPDLQAEESISTKDLISFVARFGSLKTAVDTVCENFLDAKGDVHMWYFFDMTGDDLNRKLLLERHNAFAVMDHISKRDDANHKNTVYTGDFVLRLHNQVKRGKKEELIERIKTSSGKVVYGSRVKLVDGQKKFLDKPEAFDKGLLLYLQDRTKEYTPLQSQLWVGFHSVEQKQSDGTTSVSILGLGANGSDSESELSDEVKAQCWVGYSPKGHTITKMTYTQWESKRAERLKVASTRYRHWKSTYHVESPTVTQTKLPEFDGTRYVKGSSLLPSPN